MFTGNIRPDPTYEQKVAQCLLSLQTQVSNLEKGLAEAQKDLADFKWQVKELFDKTDENLLWTYMLDLDGALDTDLENLSELVAENIKTDEKTKAPKYTTEQRSARSIEQAGDVQLTASVLSDLDIVDLRLTGPALPKPIRVLDDYDETLNLKPGEYTLKGSYQLAVTLPDSSLGGRPLVVEMKATLKPVS